MRFKEQIQKDLNHVFFNQDEFTEAHNLNGDICLAVVEALTLKQRLMKSNVYTDGYYGKTVVVHVAKKLLSEVPVNGQNFSLDGELYTIEHCTDDIGMLTIELVANDI